MASSAVANVNAKLNPNAAHEKYRSEAGSKKRAEVASAVDMVDAEMMPAVAVLYAWRTIGE